MVFSMFVPLKVAIPVPGAFSHKIRLFVGVPAVGVGATVKSKKITVLQPAGFAGSVAVNLICIVGVTNVAVIGFGGAGPPAVLFSQSKLIPVSPFKISCSMDAVSNVAKPLPHCVILLVGTTMFGASFIVMVCVFVFWQPEDV